MNWVAIATVSEIVGATAVVATLFYLAFQLRQNTQAIQGSTVHAVTQTQQSELRWASDISEAWTKSIESPAELNSSEAWKMSEWMVAAMAARQNEFLQFTTGHLEKQVWEASENVILVMLSSPWNRNWWKSFGRRTFSKEFVDLVDGLYEKDVVLVDFVALLEELKTGGAEATSSRLRAD